MWLVDDMCHHGRIGHDGGIRAKGATEFTARARVAGGKTVLRAETLVGEQALTANAILS